MEYRILNEQLSILVSSRGAELRSIMSNDTEYLWDGNKKYWADYAPLLFPFVGRLEEEKYSYQNKIYSMNIHGFVRDMEFQVGEIGESRIEFILVDSLETFEIYPFHFKLKVSYVLENNQIRIQYEVKNTSKGMMYFGIGGHPGFRVPLEKGLKFSDYFLEFSVSHMPTRVGHSKNYFINGCDENYILKEGKILALEHSMFDDDAIVLKNVADSVTLKSNKGARKITVTYPLFPYLGLWHAPHTEALYLCIEPWTSVPSREGTIENFQFKSDLIRLKANDMYRNNWKIEVN